MKIEAIIFDLGGVILDIDYNRTVRAFQALGHSSFDTQYSKLKQSGLFDDLETGRIGTDEFVSEIRKAIPQASKDQIIHAWNAIILEFPAGRLDYIAKVRNEVPTFLLSNTNEIHFACFNELSALDEFGGIKSCFDKAYLSHEIKQRKPNAGAWKIILEEQSLLPKSTLFIDDSPQHIEAANKLGLQTIHLEKMHELETRLGPFLA